MPVEQLQMKWPLDLTKPDAFCQAGYRLIQLMAGGKNKLLKIDAPRTPSLDALIAHSLLDLVRKIGPEHLWLKA